MNQLPDQHPQLENVLLLSLPYLRDGFELLLSANDPEASCAEVAGVDVTVITNIIARAEHLRHRIVARHMFLHEGVVIATGILDHVWQRLVAVDEKKL